MIPLGLAGSEISADQSGTQARIRADVDYLASDALEGRGVLTPGNQKAADYIRQSFQEDGLSGGMPDGTFFQIFPIQIGDTLNTEKSRLLLVTRDAVRQQNATRSLVLGEAYQPLSAGGAGRARTSLVFAGYGITAPQEKYDDYAGLDVRGKIVLILRKEPGQAQPAGAFDGRETTRHAFISTKLERAADAGAAAVLLVNDASTLAESGGADRLARSDAFGESLAKIPFGQMTREAVNRLLAEVPLKADRGTFSSLAKIEQQIDSTLEPVSGAMPRVTVDLDFAFDQKQVRVANVIGLVPGVREDEYVVVGAHLDHVGYGAVGSRTPGVHEIHNGADDNASGIAALLELARRTASGPKPPRSVLFIAFNGEERGLLGSNYYVAHPLFPLENTVAMINFDMVGRWGDNPLTIQGVGTASAFSELIDEVVARQGDDLQPVDTVLSKSDHYGFYLKKIPVLHFFTGLTKEYHTPADDVATLDIPGIVRAANVGEALLKAIVRRPGELEFATVNVTSPRRAEMAFLGVVPDDSTMAGGLRITGTSPDGPAEQAGLKAGDLINQVGDIPILGMEELAKALRTYKPGETVAVRVRRGERSGEFEVTLGPPKGER